ncbi:conserved Plasmodium protein, unknown function [Plasmodium knowlesi strain H]|uniref:PH domain-containing protein n=3 Tax=Plasmodium knowlesi TaxID=5850 RepID=A0A5K1U1W2_PLAKH|nr:phosphoinositide-binding protein PH2, putative [Plasmodium knowlesi strain H]OTN66419.1 Uncharacterized protein PKNOH_S09535200 [Plasmodium knowlesi]CAA9989956.1 phosphoinositide-binding protein PH2, putative [Plasmodium knowlesi strain H]SBO24537.1 conserved Plasmodium protein, unknown function [Plasmodium knowlesi strain H]SBO26391.1 conserved Plasmodium protein, unknown function [Plasmodium knowlesi strain H]VVS79430.1 phosphoinositide-binding protein PH2, putative [Plasmodium knowlesi s|eukprot:XP_002259971.1 hypothetical protein, conserved in Plasmodium species [Plasmodium knowlesi strain H]
MFDISSLIHFGNSNAVKVSISGELYVYMSKRRQNGKEFSSPLMYLHADDAGKNKDNASTILLNNYTDDYKWVKCFCFVKSNFLYVYRVRGDYRPCIIFLLEGSEVQVVDYYFALKNKIIQETKDLQLGENQDIIHIKAAPVGVGHTYTFYSTDKGVIKKWTRSLRNANFSAINNNAKFICEENEDMKLSMENMKQLSDIELRNKDIEISGLQERINSLKADIENIRMKNKRLQIAADVNIKSADELLQKKITEIEFIHGEMERKMEEIEQLKDKLRSTTTESEKKSKLVNELREERNHLEKKLKDIMATYEEAFTEPEKITLVNFNTNERYQKLVVSHKHLKEDINKMNERFYKLENEYKEKIKTIKEVVEIGDIFDYLHKLIILCQTKIKFYEQCYKYSEEQQKEITNLIAYMIKETKLSEANARVCYITHRSRILEERLLHYITMKQPSDYFHFACTTLRRLSWVFGEIEVLKPMKVSDQCEQEYPLYSYVDDMNTIPMREKIYFNEGLEGRSSYQIVNDVDVYSIPVKMCPYEDKLLTENKYNYIKIKLNDLKKDFNILKRKNKPQGRNVLSDLQWTEIKRNAYERMEKNMIILDMQMSARRGEVATEAAARKERAS